MTLEKGNYFGEIALLQKRSTRSASAVAHEPLTLIGIFQPDLEEIIIKDPLVAARLLQSVSIILTNRLFSITREVRGLKHKIDILTRNQRDSDE